MTGAPAGPACVPNIGARGRRRRAVGGAVWLALGVVALLVLRARQAPSLAFVVLLVPFTLAALGWFQAREKT